MSTIKISDYPRGLESIEGTDGVEKVSVPLSHLQDAGDRDRAYSLWGLVVGTIVILLGAYLLIASVAGGDTVIKIPIPGQDTAIEITSSVPGVIFAALGVAIIWITRPTVIKE